MKPDPIIDFSLEILEFEKWGPFLLKENSQQNTCSNQCYSNLLATFGPPCIRRTKFKFLQHGCLSLQVDL
jgi:hypothetical protein